MICLDTQILIWGVEGSCRPGQDDMPGRARRYLERLAKDGEKVLVPTPAISEYLTGSDQPDRELKVITKRFLVPAFDLRAAALATELQRNTEGCKKLRERHGIARQALRIDAMIAATAIIFGARVLATGDDHFTDLLCGRSISVYDVKDYSEQPTLSFEE